MTSLDTNILVRYLVQDDMAQYRKVTRLLTELESKHQKAFVPLLVLLETNWVLSYSYGLTRTQIIEGFFALLNLPMLVIENQQKFEKILYLAKDTRFDLSDLLIACRCEKDSHLPIMTFDKRASRLTSFELLK